MAGLWWPAVISVAWNIRSPGWETKDRCKTRHHQQGREGSLFEGSSGPRHNPRWSALIILKEGTRMPVSGPGAFAIHLSMPMLGRSPRSTANTCPSKAISPNQIESRASSHQNWAHCQCAIALRTHQFYPKRQTPNWRLRLWIPHQ